MQKENEIIERVKFMMVALAFLFSAWIILHTEQYDNKNLRGF